MKKTFMILILACLLVLPLAGCGGRAERASADEESGTEYFMLLLNTQGNGQIAYAVEGEDLVFDDRFPKQSAQISVDDQNTYVLGARASEGSEFVKWTRNNEDYSRDEVISVQFDGDAVFVAVFDYIPEE